MNTRTLAYKFSLVPTKRQAREMDRWCSASRYAWNWALAEYESALDEVRASEPDAENGKRATGSVRDVLERRMDERGIVTKSRGKNKADPTRTKSLDTVLGALLNHHRKTEAPIWASKDVHSQVWSYTNTDLCAAIKRWWAAKGKRTPWITASERRSGKKRRKGPGAKGSQGRLVGPPRYKRRDANPSWRFQAPKPRSGKLVKEEYLGDDGEMETRSVRVGATCARDTLVDRHGIRMPMHLGRVRVDDATGTRGGIRDAESPIHRLPQDAVPKVVTIRRIARTRWEASVVVQEPWEVPDVAEDLPSCGIDLGINAEATIAWSDGRIERVEPPRPMQFLGVGLAMLQRRLSHSAHYLRCCSCGHRSPLGQRDKRIRICKQTILHNGIEKECGGRVRRWRSSRGMKLVERIAKKHDQVARVRADHLHKLTHRLIDEASAICTEPHNVTGLVSAGVAKRCERLYRKGLRRRDIRRAMLDIGWGELRRQIGYKAPWKGRQAVTMPEGSATDRTCWRCGRENKMPEHTSEYFCDGCHWHGTRQENTARACLGYVDPSTVPPRDMWEDQAAE